MVVVKDCVLYMYYIEGVGGGYVFDLIKLVVYLNILFFFINLILFYIYNIVDEYLDMVMIIYYFNVLILEDIVFVDFCICKEIVNVMFFGIEVLRW